MGHGFFSELEMVSMFLSSSTPILKNKYTDWRQFEATEFTGLFGIPDVVMAFGKLDFSGNQVIHTYAFELKLKNWKRALMQAYRYSAFSHFSFVVLDFAYINPALSNLELFKKSNIGLASLDNSGKTIWYFEPKFQHPYSESSYKELSLTLSEILFTN